MTEQVWVKSSYSGGQGECVEWAPNRATATGIVPIRDSKSPHGPALHFNTAAWTAFTTSIKTGNFTT
ncbi:DUF397 domain-containing protein [Streptomyces sp. HSW2009]|uniref:DUF397 domain-containing protein n=1 Tax=Streptomyces sp. HSW2009 TaxID=3142890 RepID=UPI0032EE99C5